MTKAEARLGLSARTLAWLAKHPRAEKLVSSVWETLTELEHAGHDSRLINALRRVLTDHQPTPAGRCPTCRRTTGRRRPFPCTVWHQVRIELLDIFANSSGRHRQPAAGGPTGPSP